MAVSEDPDRLPGSRFALTEATGKGVAALLDTLGRIKTPPVAVKGQVTGPVTFCTGVKDQDGRAIFYNETLRDAAVKRLALNARWQIRTFSGPGCPVIIFIDEPALAGFGSSELISISKEEILACLREVVDAIHTDGGLAGIHVCANTDWSLVLESGADIVNFDAYAYFDRFILYGDPDQGFLAAGGMLAWGIVPTLEPEDHPARDRRYAVCPLAGAISPDRSPRLCSGDPFCPVLHHPQLRCRLPEPGPGQAGAGVDPGPVGNHS
jgi:hypothetical protein